MRTSNGGESVDNGKRTEYRCGRPASIWSYLLAILLLFALVFVLSAAAGYWSVR